MVARLHLKWWDVIRNVNLFYSSLRALGSGGDVVVKKCHIRNFASHLLFVDPRILHRCQPHLTQRTYNGRRPYPAHQSNWVVPSHLSQCRNTSTRRSEGDKHSFSFTFLEMFVKMSLLNWFHFIQKCISFCRLPPKKFHFQSLSWGEEYTMSPINIQCFT